MNSPADMPGLVAWYDFTNIQNLYRDVGRTVTVSANGQSILGVPDLSGQGNHLTAPGVAPTWDSAPTGILPTALGTSTTYMQAPDAPSISLLQGTLFVVTKSTQTNNTRWMVGKCPSGAATIEYALRFANGGGGNGSSAQVEVKNGTDGTATTAGSPALTDGTAHISSATFSSGSLSVWQDDAQNATGSTAAVLDGSGDLIVFGDHGSQGYGGYIGEVLVYNRVMKQSQRIQIIAYLADKFGITTVGTATTRTARNAVDGNYDTYHIDASRWGPDGLWHGKVSTITGTTNGRQDSHRDTDRATAEAR